MTCPCEKYHGPKGLFAIHLVASGLEIVHSVNDDQWSKVAHRPQDGAQAEVLAI